MTARHRMPVQSSKSSRFYLLWTAFTGVSMRCAVNWTCASSSTNWHEPNWSRLRRFVNAGERSQVEVIRAEAGVAQQLEAIIVAENNLRDRERRVEERH